MTSPNPRVWTFGGLNNPPDPDPVADAAMHVTTTKRHYELGWLNPGSGATWYPTAAPANGKLWDEWLLSWGPLTEVVA